MCAEIAISKCLEGPKYKKLQTPQLNISATVWPRNTHFLPVITIFEKWSEFSGYSAKFCRNSEFSGIEGSILFPKKAPQKCCFLQSRIPNFHNFPLRPLQWGGLTFILGYLLTQYSKKKKAMTKMLEGNPDICIYIYIYIYICIYLYIYICIYININI